MVTRKNVFATLGVCAMIAAGIATVGATPAKADSLRIGDYRGHVGFSLSIGTPNYYYAPPVYVAPEPVYEGPAYYGGYYQPQYYSPRYYAPVYGGWGGGRGRDWGGRGDWGHDRGGWGHGRR